jgi:threonine/homoserine/homoserine lactone efflux protein
MASGFAVVVFAAVGLSSKRLPSLLAGLMIVAGLIETIEWAVPAILILDPLLGAVWSIWLGSLLWKDRIAAPGPHAHQVAPGDGL